MEEYHLTGRKLGVNQLIMSTERKGINLTSISCMKFLTTIFLKHKKARPLGKA